MIRARIRGERLSFDLLYRDSEPFEESVEVSDKRWVRIRGGSEQ